MRLFSTLFPVIDATGTIPAGLFEGTLSDFGDYDECLSLRSTANYTNPFMRGKHCIIKLKLYASASKQLHLEDSFLVKNDFSLNIGLCLPSICSADDIRQVLVKGERRKSKPSNFLTTVFHSTELGSSYRFEERIYCDEGERTSQLAQLSVAQLLSM